MTDEDRIELARKLFEEGWSGGHADAPLAFLTEDAVMRDIAGHPEAMRGHDAIRDFFAPVAEYLKVMPEEYFVSERGVALTWIAYIAIVKEGASSDEPRGYLCGEGMSRLEFRDGKVSLEIDYWHGPQGEVEYWESHLAGRRAMKPDVRGARTGI